MDLLIKKMKMPKACYWIDDEHNSHSCPLMEFGHLCQANGACVEGCTEERYDDCPLVEVPPHGRLIDANDLIESLKYRCENENLRCNRCEVWNACEVRPIYEDVKNAEVVLEATE